MTERELNFNTETHASYLSFPSRKKFKAERGFIAAELSA
jgi:hypothetical protein